MWKLHVSNYLSFMLCYQWVRWMGSGAIVYWPVIFIENSSQAVRRISRWMDACTNKIDEIKMIPIQMRSISVQCIPIVTVRCEFWVGGVINPNFFGKSAMQGNHYHRRTLYIDDYQLLWNRIGKSWYKHVLSVGRRHVPHRSRSSHMKSPWSNR